MGDIKKFGFENLDAWKLSIELSKEIYKITTQWPESEKYGLTSQIRIAINSISLNIAEGNGKYSLMEKAKFTSISYCSSQEVMNAIILANALGFISENIVNHYRTKIKILTKKLASLRNSQLKRHETQTINPKHNKL